MRTENLHRLWVRVKDDLDAMHLLEPLSWTRWQKLVIGYGALFVTLSIISFAVLVPLGQKNKALRGEVSSLKASLMPVNISAVDEPTLKVERCSIKDYVSAREFLESAIGPSELLGFERESTDRERISAEISAEFIRLSSMIGCFAGDEDWQLVRWQLRRGGKDADYMPIANIELAQADE